MRKWRSPIIVLVLFLIGGVGITLLNLGRTDIDAIEINLEIPQATDAASKAIDDAVLHAIETGSLSPELRIRLQKPLRSVYINDFHVDACEVSQGEYESFLEWLETRGDETSEPTIPEWLRSLSTKHRTAGIISSPASGVTQAGAVMYCEMVGGRLPQVEELEVAASGIEGRLYPWGDEFDGSAWPFMEPDRNAQQACGTHWLSSTPDGIHDLANNVMEWTIGTMSPELLQTPDLIPVMGAPPVRTRARELYALSAAWYAVQGSVQSHHLGFRCVYDTPPRPILPWDEFRGETVYVKGGEYQIGVSPDARVTAFMTKIPSDADIPLRELARSMDQIPDRLRVDRCEVTRGEYAQFLQDPLVQAGLYANDREPSRHSHIPLDWAEQQKNPDLPVTGVTWWSADAFARWSRGRLPTAEEWRAIAAGGEGRIYPWGDIYEPNGAAVGDDAEGTLVPCRETTLDVTVDGVRHLGGNVSEWTRSISHERGALTMWVHGGNWILPGLKTAQTVFGRKVTLGHRSRSIGFRVVYD